jgi:hypothetical protein
LFRAVKLTEETVILFAADSSENKKQQTDKAMAMQWTLFFMDLELVEFTICVTSYKGI